MKIMYMVMKEKSEFSFVNLGTPDAPSTSAVRKYLSEFLSDPRIVEIPRLIWWLILKLYNFKY